MTLYEMVKEGKTLETILNLSSLERTQRKATQKENKILGVALAFIPTTQEAEAGRSL